MSPGWKLSLPRAAARCRVHAGTTILYLSTSFSFPSLPFWGCLFPGRSVDIDGLEDPFSPSPVDPSSPCAHLPSPNPPAGFGASPKQVSCNLTDAAAAAALCHSAAASPQSTVVRDAAHNQSKPRDSRNTRYWCATYHAQQWQSAACRTPHMPHARCQMPDASSRAFPFSSSSSLPRVPYLRPFGHGCPNREGPRPWECPITPP